MASTQTRSWLKLAMKTFIADNLVWRGKEKALQGKQIRHWHSTWRKSTANVAAAVADKRCHVGVGASLLKTKAPMTECARQRAFGGGRPKKAPLVRQALYEWWCSIRYAIDWKQLVADRRSRGKKSLARFLAQSWFSKSSSSSKSLPMHPC